MRRAKAFVLADESSFPVRRENTVELMVSFIISYVFGRLSSVPAIDDAFADTHPRRITLFRARPILPPLTPKSPSNFCNILTFTRKFVSCDIFLQRFVNNSLWKACCKFCMWTQQNQCSKIKFFLRFFNTRFFFFCFFFVCFFST